MERRDRETERDIIKYIYIYIERVGDHKGNKRTEDRGIAS